MNTKINNVFFFFEKNDAAQNMYENHAEILGGASDVLSMSSIGLSQPYKNDDVSLELTLAQPAAASSSALNLFDLNM